jgi:hypothetical protein
MSVLCVFCLYIDGDEHDIIMCNYYTWYIIALSTIKQALPV